MSQSTLQQGVAEIILHLEGGGIAAWGVASTASAAADKTPVTSLQEPNKQQHNRCFHCVTLGSSLTTSEKSLRTGNG